MASGKTPKKSWSDPTRRPSKDEYPTWLEAVHDVKLEREKVRFEASIDKIVAAATESDFWTEYRAQRRDIAAAYQDDTGFKLFAFPNDDQPQQKSWDSLLLKSFRKNILNNNAYPSPPEGDGWLLPANWLPRVNDVVRTTLVVKYLDGVKILTDSLESIAGACGVKFRSDLQARDTGYYAAHTYATFSVDLPQDDWNLKRHTLDLEVQITTQLQEVMGKLTHRQYERRRELPATASLNWQWDHASDAFQPNYLGHLLHYAEGMIMEVRNRDSAQ